MTVGSLFSGIGGLDLGLEWAGMETEWFCEIEPFAQEVLKRHWPDKTIISDIRDINEEAIAEGSIRPVDIIAGGFPCQDISYAGKRRGLDYDLDTGEGTRSGLWWEMWRVIRLLRPRYVIAENVPGLFTGGIDLVLGSLAQIGYDAEWEVLSAGIVDSRGNALTGVGAPHQRDRVFIVAYAADAGHQFREVSDQRRQPAEQEPRGNGEARRSGCLDSLPQPSWFGGLWPQPWPVSFKREDAGNGGSLHGEHGQPEASAELGNASSEAAALPRELERVAAVGDVRRVADGLPRGMVEKGVMWPTPGAGEGGGGVVNTRSGGPALATKVKMEMWPTARGQDSYERRNKKTRHRIYNEGGDLTLPTKTRTESELGLYDKMWPTANARDWKDTANTVPDSIGKTRGFSLGQIMATVDRGEANIGDGYIYTDVPDRTGRLKGLGNAVVPQVGYLVGRAVMEHAKETGRL